MNTWVKVARYQLMRRASYLALLWILAFCFAVGAVSGAGNRYLFGVVIYFAILGMQTIGRPLPFALTLGASRRSFYSGTALLGMTLALVSGLVLTMLQAIERATGGWGLSLQFFRVPYLLNGPWYVTWLTSFVGLSAVFAYGMWYGIANTRWGLLGTLVFIAVQVVLVVAGVVVGSFEHWHVLSRAGGSFVGLTALGLTGVIAALAVLLLVGGHATIRRATV
jgi:hypothetical protein